MGACCIGPNDLLRGIADIVVPSPNGTPPRARWIATAWTAPADLVSFRGGDGLYTFPPGHPMSSRLEDAEERDIFELFDWHGGGMRNLWGSGGRRVPEHDSEPGETLLTM